MGRSLSRLFCSASFTPELCRATIPTLLVAPPPTQPQIAPAGAPTTSSVRQAAEAMVRITAPRVIPRNIPDPNRGDQVFIGPNITLETGPGTPGGDGNPFESVDPLQSSRPLLRPSFGLPSSLRKARCFTRPFRSIRLSPRRRANGALLCCRPRSRSPAPSKPAGCKRAAALRQAAMDAVRHGGTAVSAESAASRSGDHGERNLQA